MALKTLLAALLLLPAFASAPAGEPALQDPPAKVDFVRDIQPILKASCL